jgi:hypothetical protein
MRAKRGKADAAQDGCGQRLTACSVMGVDHAGKRVELVERWWRGQGPFQRRRTLAPRIVGRALLAPERIDHAVHEHEQADEENVGANRRHQVSAGEGVRVVGVAARHAREAEKVLREEQHVGADEGDPEMKFPIRSEYT